MIYHCLVLAMFRRRAFSAYQVQMPHVFSKFLQQGSEGQYFGLHIDL
jgi:hypothetical protein